MKGLFTLGFLAVVLTRANAATITATLCDTDSHCEDYAVIANGSCCMYLPLAVLLLRQRLSTN